MLHTFRSWINNVSDEVNDNSFYAIVATLLYTDTALIFRQ